MTEGPGPGPGAAGPGPGTHLLLRWVHLTFALRWPILAIAIAGAAFAGTYAVGNLRVDTDRDAMLSADLEFRKNHERYQTEFPHSRNNLVVVVDGPVPEDATAAAAEIAARAREREDLFENVFLPRGDDFLVQNALLFLSHEELLDFIDRLAQVQPFLGRLAADPSLRGLCGTLEEAVRRRGEGREAEIGPLASRVAATIRAALQGEPGTMSWQEMMFEDQGGADRWRQYVLLQLRVDHGRLFPGHPARDFVRGVVSGLGVEASGVTVRMTGGIALADEELESVMDGAGRIAALVTLMVGIVLYLALRSKRLVGATLVALLVGLSFTAAFAIAVVGHLNLISIVFAVLYVGLGVDYAIHLGMRYQELRFDGLASRKALLGAVRDVGSAVVFCAATTALGFYSFIPTDYRGVSELGLISGTGMFIGLVVTLTLYPVLIDIVPPARMRARYAPAGARQDFPVRKSRLVLGGTLVLALASAAAVPRLRFDFNPLNLRDPETESVATFRDLLRTSETPPWSLQILCPDAGCAREKASALEELEEVGLVLTPSSFVPADQEEKLEAIEEAAFLLGAALEVEETDPLTPEERVGAARSLLAAMGEARDAVASDPDLAELGAALGELVERAQARGDGELLARLETRLVATLPRNFARLRRGLDAGPITLDDLPPERLRRWVSPAGTHLVLAYPAGDLDDPAAMRRFLAAVRSVDPGATGAPSTILGSGDAIVSAFRRALLLAVLATVLVLLALMRRVREVVLVLTPLLLAGLFTGATMVATGLSFNFANVIGLPLLLGIGVDSSIHMVHRASRRLSPEQNPLHTSTARAVVFSSLTTLCSFLNLAFSPHPGTASMGILLTIGIGWTLVCTLVVLPALLTGWSRGGQGPGRNRPTSP